MKFIINTLQGTEMGSSPLSIIILHRDAREDKRLKRRPFLRSRLHYPQFIHQEWNWKMTGETASESEWMEIAIQPNYSPVSWSIKRSGVMALFIGSYRVNNWMF